MSKKTKVIKVVARLVVSASVGYVASALLGRVVPVHNLPAKIASLITITIAGGMAGDLAAEYAEETISDFVDALELEA